MNLNRAPAMARTPDAASFRRRENTVAVNMVLA